MRPAYMEGALYIPLKRFTPKELKALKHQLTYKYTPMGERVALQSIGYLLTDEYIGVPRQFGVRYCNQLQIEWENRTAQGVAVKFPQTPTPREYQVAPLGKLYEAFDHYFDVLFRAHTGWGKTIGALVVAARLSRNVIIVVDQDNLKEQWLKVLTDPALFGFRESQVGIVQGDRADYEGKAVTIAMVQTLTARNYGEEFYGHFGTLIGDEVHTLGAPTFSQVLLKFACTYRLFVSATPRRRDGLQRALENNCGHVRVSADKEHKESKVYVYRTDSTFSWYANISPKVGRMLSEVAEDGRRNLDIAKIGIWLWETGRDVLILSDRVEHLKHLQSLLYYLGIPEEELGLYTGYEPSYKFMKNPTPTKRPRGLHREWNSKDSEWVYAEYTPVALLAQEKTVPKNRLKEIETLCSVILATYGKFAKGTDVPRLAGGIDATPRSTSEQVQGRILRELEDKLQPIWVTPVDENNYRLLNSFASRISEYEKSNSVLFEWDGRKELREWKAKQLKKEVLAEVSELRGREIRQDSNGRFRVESSAESRARKRKDQQKTADALKKRPRPR